MKKFLILLLTIVLCSSCLNERGKYRVNYDVIYPDTTITYDTIFKYDWVYKKESNTIPCTNSIRGTNYIRIGINTYNRTTCPIRINSYEQIEVEHYRGL